jgi:phenylacetate-coenzyme A ligase PaaK-like adenylate-forming protein
MWTVADVAGFVSALARRDRLPERYRDHADRKFRRLLRHAATTVPWYSRLCREAQIDPTRSGLEVLGRLPLTGKADWHAHPPSEFHSHTVDLSGCRFITTSGTTGSPDSVPYTAADQAARRVATQRCFWAAGVGLGDRYAWIRAAQRHPARRRLHERLGVLRTLHLDLLVAPETYWEAVRRWAPRGLLGFPLETEALAMRIEQGKLAPLAAPVVCGVYGEPVEPETRERIEAALGPVREMYGSTEGGTVAWECGNGRGLHVNADMVVVEFLENGRPVPPGQPGEIVLTNLHSWAMPVIRYAQGDRGWEVPGPCPCGRPGPLIRAAPSFRLQPFRLPSGRRLSARFFVQALPAPDWLLHWQAEQSAPDHLRLVLTASRPVAPAELQAIAKTVRRGCWEPIVVEVECREAVTGAGHRARDYRPGG